MCASFNIDSQNTTPSLPFKMIYTNIVLVLKSRRASATINPPSLLVYMILSHEGGLTGCDLHGAVIFSFLYNMSIQYSWVF